MATKKELYDECTAKGLVEDVEYGSITVKELLALLEEHAEVEEHVEPKAPAKNFGAVAAMNRPPAPKSKCARCANTSCRALMEMMATFVSDNRPCPKFVPLG